MWREKKEKNEIGHERGRKRETDKKIGRWPFICSNRLKWDCRLYVRTSVV